MVPHGAEVDEHQPPVAVPPHHVRRLHVTVNDRRGEAVEVAEDRRELVDDRPHFILGVAPLLELLGQGPPRDEFHLQEEPLPRLARDHEVRPVTSDARVLELTQHSDLTQGEGPGLVAPPERQLLDPNDLARLQVRRPPGHAARATAERALQPPASLQSLQDRLRATARGAGSRRDPAVRQTHLALTELAHVRRVLPYRSLSDEA